MKKITYTQFRRELSKFLDDMRNGEVFVITQKGKPNLIIHNITDNAESYKRQLQADEIKSKIVSLIQNTNTAQIPPEIVNGINKMVKKIEEYLHSEEAQQISQKITNTSEFLKKNAESFEKALILTQKKYAHIIKALEDK